MKRLVWFTAGAAAGVGGAAYAKRKARQAAERYKPVNMAKGAVDRVADAVREGRAAMAAKEAELKARQEHRARAGAARACAAGGVGARSTRRTSRAADPAAAAAASSGDTPVMAKSAVAHPR